MSGIVLHDDALAVFNQQKLQHNAAAVVYCLNPELTHVVVEKVFPPETPLSEVVDFLPPRDCRFITYDLKYVNDGCQMSKLTFILWCPESAKTKPKMLYSATKRACIEKMTGVQLEV